MTNKCKTLFCDQLEKVNILIHNSTFLDKVITKQNTRKGKAYNSSSKYIKGDICSLNGSIYIAEKDSNYISDFKEITGANAGILSVSYEEIEITATTGFENGEIILPFNTNPRKVSISSSNSKNSIRTSYAVDKIYIRVVKNGTAITELSEVVGEFLYIIK